MAFSLRKTKSETRHVKRTHSMAIATLHPSKRRHSPPVRATNPDWGHHGFEAMVNASSNNEGLWGNALRLRGNPYLWKCLLVKKSFFTSKTFIYKSTIDWRYSISSPKTPKSNMVKTNGWYPTCIKCSNAIPMPCLRRLCPLVHSHPPDVDVVETRFVETTWRRRCLKGKRWVLKKQI